ATHRAAAVLRECASRVDVDLIAAADQADQTWQFFALDVSGHDGVKTLEARFREYTCGHFELSLLLGLSRIDRGREPNSPHDQENGSGSSEYAFDQVMHPLGD